MTEALSSIISHVSLGTNNMPAALVFYDALMSTVGAVRKHVIESEDTGIVAVAYGRQFPEFWLQVPDNQQPASVGNGVHIAFIAANEHSVRQFYETALEHGGRDNGPPGPRPHYGAEYYGCFVFDLDGNKLEATFWDAEKSGLGVPIVS
jgi:catechol 2,3-dioxygenase-like lactoylglutathione lyase family enzyme